MLIANIIHLLQLFAVGALHDGSLKDASEMFMMGNSSAVVTILKTFYDFSMAFCRLCQPLIYIHGLSAFECILQVGELINISQVAHIMNSVLELLPKRPLV